MFELFFSPERPFALLVNLVLLALTAWALSILFLRYRQAAGDQKAVEQVGLILGASKGAADPEARRDSRKRLREAIDEVAPRTLIHQRVSDLEAAGDRHDPDMGGLTALNREELRDALAFPSALAPTLVLLGLLGTLWGLSSAVAELSGTLSTTNFSAEELKSAILGTLGGMKIAFSTTLLGIVGTILVRSGTNVVRHRQSRLLRKIERVLATQVVPLFEVSEKTALPEAAAALTQIKETLKSDLGTLTKNLETRGKDLSDQLKTRFEQMEKNFHDRAEKLLGETRRAMDGVLEILGERSEGDPSLAEYVQAVQLTTEKLNESARIAGGLIPDLEDRLKSVIKEQGESLHRSLTSYSEEVTPVLRNQAEATEALVETATGSRDAISALREQLETLSTSFEQARASWERIDSLVEGVGEACSRSISTGLRNFVEELEEQTQATQQDRERVLAALANLQSSLTGTLDRLHDERTAAQERSVEVLQTTRSVLSDGLDRMLRSLVDNQKEHGEGYVRAMREMAQELRDLQIAGNGRAKDAKVPLQDFSWSVPLAGGSEIDSAGEPGA